MAEARITLSAADKTRQAFASARGELERIKAKAAEVNTSFGALGAVLGPAFAGVTLAAFVKGTVASLDKLNDLKDATGASIENISALEDVAARTGTSFDDMSTALVRFNGFLKDADPGTKQANMLKQIGLNAQDLQRIDPAEALRQTAVALSQFADDGDKARFVQEAFGKSIGKVAPLLNDLANQQRLVGTVTAEQAAEAEKFNHQLERAAKNSLDLSRALVGPVISGLNETIDAFKRAREEGSSFLDFLTQRFNQSNGFQAQGKDAAIYAAQIARLTKEIDSNTLSEERRQAYMEKRATLQRQMNAIKINQAVDQAGDIPQDPRLRDQKSIGKTAAADKKAHAEAIDANSVALGTYVEGLQRAIDKEENLTQVEKAQAFLLSIGRTGEIEQVRELVLSLAAKADAAKTAADLERDVAKAKGDATKLAAAQLAVLDKEVEARLRDNDALEEYVAGIGLSVKAIEAQKTARLEAAAAAEEERLQMAQNIEGNEADIAVREQSLALLRRQIALRKQAAAEIARLEASPRAGVDAAVSEYTDAVANVAQQTHDATARTIADLEDGLTGVLTGQKDAFHRLVDDLINEVIRLNVVRPILASIFGGGGGGASGAISFFASLFGGARAAGGPVEADRAYLVGERGPEIFMPTGAGTVLPNGAAVGAPAMVFNNTYNVGAGTPLSQVVAIVQAGNRSLEAKILRSRRRDGAFAA